MSKSAPFSDAPTDAVIVSACRSPIGRIRGALSGVRADDLLAQAFDEAFQRSGLDDKSVFDEAFAGCANQAGEDNRNVARMAILLGGFDQSVPGVTLNRLCASGLEAVVQASRAIRVGEIQACLAGGVENMSRAPFVMEKPATGFMVGAPQVFDSSLGWRFPNPKMKKLLPLEQMGETAENVVEEFSISRADQDAFALASHEKALAAQEKGFFDDEMFSVSIPQRKKEDLVVDKDEGPRKDSSLEKLGKLRAAFREGGSVTAGNSSSLNDGSAALVVTSRAFAKERGLTIRATIRGAASAGVNPRTMGIGPVPATQKVLKHIGLTVGDLDAVELNEAFAAQSLAVIRSLELDESIVNQHGGAIALGHPLGCSGARILTTLLSVLDRTDGNLGLATLCVGVGQGLSVVIERS
ncbi:MAG: acetyl-CoA C-acyltransferase [Deltaproteobacteria bacterium]|nr:acetyl-CoA C-acyltransferase [Deltaproteobacteria bacterium]